MDSLFAIVRRLTLACAALVLLFAALPSMACTNAAYQTYTAAMSACQAAIARNAGNGVTYTCTNRPPVNGGSGDVHLQGSDGGYGDYQYCGDATASNPCSSQPTTTVNVRFTNQAPPGSSGATWVTDQSTGKAVLCPYTITYSNFSALSDAQGFFHVQATVSYNGNPSGSESSTATAGTSVYNDASGNPLSPQPSPDPSPAPQLCGGTSCADPSTGNVCAVVGGSQVCQKFPAWTPNMTGGCSGGGTGAICAGSPTAPAPQPGQGGVTDPTTQIAGSDHYTSKNMSTGQVSTVVVNTFSGLAGQTVTNGANSTAQNASNSSGSSKPASSSSSGGSGYGSGGDCNSPPVCTGDAVMCGIARQEWYAMCSAKASADSLDKHIAGDGNGPSTFATDSTKYGQGDVWSQPDTSQDGTVGGQANKGVYDQSGFGFNTTCPLTDLNVPFFSGSFAIPLSEGCVIGPWLRAIIIGFALFSAAVITAGGRG